MAINPLYGYDTQALGFGQANTPGPGRKYPAWMSDPNARGIGTAQDFTPTRPGFIDIPRYLEPAQTQQQGNALTGGNPYYGPMVGDPTYNQSFGEGGGAGGGNTGGPQGFDNGGQPDRDFGILGALGFGGNGNYGGFSPQTPTNEMPNELGFAANNLGGALGNPQMPGDVTGTQFAGQVADIAQQMGPTSGSAPLGQVDVTTMDNPGDQTADAGSGGAQGSGGAGGNSEATGGGSQGDTGGPAGSGGNYRGGIITRNKLQGPNPAGPDDGYGALDVGEGVLTAKAIKHYGPAIVAALNKLQVPKAALAKR